VYRGRLRGRWLQARLSRRRPRRAEAVRSHCRGPMKTSSSSPRRVESVIDLRGKVAIVTGGRSGIGRRLRVAPWARLAEMPR
jgi:hypothetical protein